MAKSGIDDDEVARVARLARIRLDDDERARLAEQLATLLEHFEELKAIDTDGIEPTFHTVDASPLRSDEPRECLALDGVAEGAPHWVEGAFAVPKVYEEL